MKRLNQLLLALGLILLSSATLMASTCSWTGGGGNALWTTALNWDTAPMGGEDIVFPSVANQTVDLAGGTYNIATLTFNSPKAYSLANGGPGLTLGGNVSQNGAGAVTVNAGIDLGGANRNFGGSGAGVVTLNNTVIRRAGPTGRRTRPGVTRGRRWAGTGHGAPSPTGGT